MRIAYYGVSNIFCSWNFSDGIPATLRRMGHEVAEDIEDATGCDLILVSGAEHRTWWGTGARVPRVAWYHETADRSDHDFGPAYVSLVQGFDLNYFIRKADAYRFGGTWLPFAVDDKIFFLNGAYPAWEDRKHKVAFVGQLYDSRVKFLNEYRRLGGPEIEILQFVGDGMTPRLRAEALADSHRNTQIFVVLPTLIRATPCKVYEAAACGCAVVAPHVDDYSDLADCYFYSEASPATLVEAVAKASDSRASAMLRGKSLSEIIGRYYTLEKRLQQIIDDVKGLR